MNEKKKSSRSQFREYIKRKGIFGNKPDDEKDKKDNGKDITTDDARDSDQEKKPIGPYLIRFIKELKDQRLRLVLVLVMSVIDVFLMAAFPWSSKFIIDSVLSKNDVYFLFSCCGLLAVIAIGSVSLSLLKDYTVRSLAGNFTVNIKHRLMKHLQKLPLVKLQDQKVGGIISRLQQDTEGMSQLLFSGLLTPFMAFLMLGVAVVSLIIINWQVTVVCLGFCIFVMGTAYLFFNLLRPLQKSLRESNSSISADLAEVFGGVQVIRSFGKERTENRRYGLATDLLWRKYLYSGVMGMTVHRTVWILYYFMIVAIWMYGGYNTIKGNMTVGGLMAFIAFMEWLFRPIFMIMHSFSQLQENLACTERTFDLLDEDPGMMDRPGAVAIDKFEKGIKFNNVTFDYPDGTRALENFNLFIPKGKVTALVGVSGSGKSTTTNLVLRFYDVTEGSITIDGVDIRDLKLSSYRQLISLVLQDVFLFDGTVRENIAYGDENVSLEEIKRVAKIAHCHEFVEELAEKYDTVIGEKGVKLSGGQKQRIALARALLVNPQLLILDEATSNLDSESEGYIQDALREIFKTKTTLVIAHRLSTIMDADNIVVLDKGAVIEQGSHNELLDKQGRYHDMYERQMKKAERLKNYWLPWENRDAELETQEN